MKWLDWLQLPQDFFSHSSVDIESACNAGDPGSIPGSGRSPGEGIGYPLQYSWASLVAQLVKNPPAMQETWFQSLGLGRSPGEGKGYPLQYSGLENSMDCLVHGVTKSWTLLRDFHFWLLHILVVLSHFFTLQLPSLLPHLSWHLSSSSLKHIFLFPH